MAQIFKEEKVVRGKNVITMGEEIRKFVKREKGDLEFEMNLKIDNLKEDLGDTNTRLDEAIEEGKKELKKAIASVYRYCGTVATYDDLPEDDLTVGDVYNVAAPYEDYGPGSNWSWNGEDWDALGGDLSEVIYKTEMVETTEAEFSELLGIPIE